MFPNFSITNKTNSLNGDIKMPSYINKSKLSRVSKIADHFNICIFEFCTTMSFTTSVCFVFDRILIIFSLCSPHKITNTIICWVSIKMPGHHTLGTGANIGF